MGLSSIANARQSGVYLDIGAGGPSKKANFVSIDISDAPGVDLVGDAFDLLSQIDDDKVDGLYSRHFLEHVDDVPAMVREMVRVCRNGAAIEIIVPHFSSPFFYSDVTHKRHFGLYSFSYMAVSEIGFKRSVPKYARIPGLVETSIDLGFRSYKPRYVRYGLKKVFQYIFNSSIYMKELYEEFFCWWVPCYEIRYVLTVRKP